MIPQPIRYPCIQHLSHGDGQITSTQGSKDQVAGTRVTCAVTRRCRATWTKMGSRGISEQDEGQCLSRVLLEHVIYEVEC